MGSGRVGVAVAFLCVSNELDDVLLVNRTKNKAVGEALDIANAIPSTSKFSIRGTDDYSELAKSTIVVIAASMKVYMKERTENMPSQVKMVRKIAAKIKHFCPSAIILLVSNPLDVLTYFFQKESMFPRFKVIGIASSLDTSRFRYIISQKFSVPQASITNALVLGEHGDSMVPIFSDVNVSGNPLVSVISSDEKESMTYDVRNYWQQLRHYKSRSQFGIAKKTFDVIETIVNKKELFIPASVVLEGEYGENNVAMGVPVKINKNGIAEINEIQFDESEQKLLRLSAQTIRNNILHV